MERKRKREQCVIHLDGIKESMAPSHASQTWRTQMTDNASDDGLGDADECDSSSLDSDSDTYWFLARFKFHAKVGLLEIIVWVQPSVSRYCETFLIKYDKRWIATIWNVHCCKILLLTHIPTWISMPKHWQCNESEVFSEIMKLPSMSIVVAFLLLHRFLVGTCCRSTGNWMNQEKCFLKLWNLQVQLDKRWTIAI